MPVCFELHSVQYKDFYKSSTIEIRILDIP